jgi:hypothetical protein
MNNINRRSFIQIVGSTAVVYANTSLLLACSSGSERLPDPYAGWAGPAASTDDIRIWALSYAILAPNPHNRQPWIADLRKKDEIEIYIDPKRLLPVTDPFSRQIVIGTGAFIEVLRMAAAEKGYTVESTLLWPATSGELQYHLPFARLKFSKSQAPLKDPLFRDVLLRSTVRKPHDLSKALPSKIVEVLETAKSPGLSIHFSKEKYQVGLMQDLSLRAMERELRTRAAYKESVDLFRIGESEIAKNPDGLSLRGFMLENLNRFGLLNRDELLDTKSSSFQRGLETTLTPLKSSASFMWIISEGITTAHHAQAGRAYVRAQLALTQLGLSVQPVSQALQEYSEMKDLRAEAYQIMNVPQTATLQMWARVGFSEKGPLAPRWPVKSFFKI